MRRLIAGTASFGAILALSFSALAQDAEQDRTQTTPEVGVPVQGGVARTPPPASQQDQQKALKQQGETAATRQGARGLSTQPNALSGRSPGQAGSQQNAQSPYGTANPTPGSVSSRSTERHSADKTAPTNQLGRTTNDQSTGPNLPQTVNKKPGEGQLDTDPQRNAEREHPTPPAMAHEELRERPASALGRSQDASTQAQKTQQTPWLREKDGAATVHPNDSHAGSPLAERGPHARLKHDPSKRGEDAHTAGIIGPKFAKQERKYVDDKLSPRRETGVNINEPKPEQRVGDEHVSPALATGVGALYNSPTRGTQSGNRTAPGSVAAPGRPGSVGTPSVGSGPHAGGGAVGVGTPSTGVGNPAPGPTPIAMPAPSTNASARPAARPDPGESKAEPGGGGVASHSAAISKPDPGTGAAKPDPGTGAAKTR